MLLQPHSLSLCLTCSSAPFMKSAEWSEGRMKGCSVPFTSLWLLGLHRPILLQTNEGLGNVTLTFGIGLWWCKNAFKKCNICATSSIGKVQVPGTILNIFFEHILWLKRFIYLKRTCDSCSFLTFSFALLFLVLTQWREHYGKLGQQCKDLTSLVPNPLVFSKSDGDPV